MKHKCTECGGRTKSVAYLKLVGGTIVYVCLECWDLHHYEIYFTDTASIIDRLRS